MSAHIKTNKVVHFGCCKQYKHVKMEDKKKLMCAIFTQGLILLDSLDEDEEYQNFHYGELEEMCIILACPSIKKPIPRLKNFVEEIVPTYNNKQFRSHFRMRRSTFYYVLHLIKPSLIRSKPGHKTISPDKQFLIAIWKMATPDSYRSICEKFNVGKATALKAVRRVTKAIVNLGPLFIKWPEGEKVEEVFKGFVACSAFPNVIGAIDGTHINIKAPHSNPECYINRKGHHFIHLQAICDHKLQFTYCLAGHVGSIHDQRVFRLSEVYEYLEDPEKFPNDSHIIGDAAYTIHNHLMIPFRDNGHLTEKQKNYNFCHASARITIERAFGLLKGRFRSLLTILDMERIDLIPDFILASCVLHNICLLQDDNFPVLELDMMENNYNLQHINQRRDRNAGHLKRDIICNNLLMRNI